MVNNALLSLMVVLSVGAPAAAQAPPEPIAWTTHWFHDDAKRNFLQAAELMPAED